MMTKLKNTPTDKRLWTVLDDRFGSDTGPCGTSEIYDFAEQCNQEGDGTPFRLYDAGNEIWDIGGDSGDVLVAQLYVGPAPK
jgi:hypothetical protein